MRKNLKNEIINTLNELCSKLQRLKKYDNPTWTKEIKKKFVELGHLYNYSVCAHSVKHVDWGEWLYDLCWLEHVDNPIYPLIKSCPLILESEWKSDKNSIIEDFQKLLLGNAKI